MITAFLAEGRATMCAFPGGFLKDGAGGGSRTHPALRPADFLAAALSRCRGARSQGLGSGLSLHPLPEVPGLRCCPSRRYTFPKRYFGLGSGLSLIRFPEFEYFCIAGFPASAQVLSEFAASAIALEFKHTDYGFRVAADA